MKSKNLVEEDIALQHYWLHFPKMCMFNKTLKTSLQ